MADARREQEEARVRLAAEAARLASWQAMLQAEAQGGRAALQVSRGATVRGRGRLCSPLTVHPHTSPQPR